ncbi:MAG: tRNA pseudouridine(55) synthase TruB [Campylobacterales bacterium]
MSHGLLLAADKPAGISSNRFLGELKRNYGFKKGGFSGTLDPFAEGVLVVALGTYTRLFPYLNFSPKRYLATLLLGAYSPTLDNEQIERIEDVKPIDPAMLLAFIKGLKGPLTMPAPHYSAKHINGKRAYDLARAGIAFETPLIQSNIIEVRLISYEHPFVVFEATVSQGTYIRSLGAHIAAHFGYHGALTRLRRLSEGNFTPSNNPIDPLPHLAYPILTEPIDASIVRNGKPITMLPEEIHGRVVLYYPQRFLSIIERNNEGGFSYLATIDL